MGYLTTIVINNDRLHEWRKNPLLFTTHLFGVMDRTDMEHKKQSTAGGYITAFPSRHADDCTIFLHKGNTLTDLNAHNQDLLDLMHTNPKLVRENLKVAQQLLTSTKKKLAQITKITNKK